MRDVAEGALQALAWVWLLLQEKNAEEARREVEEAIKTILKGVGKDFKIIIEPP